MSDEQAAREISPASHREKFFGFIKALNEKKLKYVIMRGYRKLPVTPDTDIDFVCHRDSYKDIIAIVKRFLQLNTKSNTPLNYQIGGKNCQYTQWWTTGEVDQNIANGRFTMDTYNHFFFRSRGGEMVVLSDEFEDEIFSQGIQQKDEYFILKPRYEILMYGYRNVFDLQNKFKQKHIKIIKELIRENPSLQNADSFEDFSQKDSKARHVIEQVLKRV